MSFSDDPDSNCTLPPLFITSFEIHVRPESRKHVKTVSFKAGDVAKEYHQLISPGGRYQETFKAPLEVLSDSKITISCHLPSNWRFHSSNVSISLEPREVLSEAEKDGKQVYSKIEKNVEFTIGIQSLPSTVSEIVASCSRFRVLIIGGSGVGKSSLINKVFGVTDVYASDVERGDATIENEYIANDNKHFVIHDSRGFEAGDYDNLDTVCNFIASRRRQQDVKDQLHAVWLCLAIPYAGGRLIEAGVAEFLRDRRKILGDIPLVVVLTKLDLLSGMLNTDAIKEGVSLEKETLDKLVQDKLETLCFAPIRAAAGAEGVSHVAVSTKEESNCNLVELVGETTTNIKKFIKNEAVLYVATIAQRVNVSLKVKLTYVIGEKRYMKALRAKSDFRGDATRKCLDGLHNDIVEAWNFRRPYDCLQRNDFKDWLYDVPDLGTGGSMKQFMAYIVDLTWVLQTVFLLVAVRPQGSQDLKLSLEVVDVAKHSYDPQQVTLAYEQQAMNAQDQPAAHTHQEQSHRTAVHAEIRDFRVPVLAVIPGKRDEVLGKIKELITEHRVSDYEVAELRGLLRWQHQHQQ